MSNEGPSKKTYLKIFRGSHEEKVALLRDLDSSNYLETHLFQTLTKISKSKSQKLKEKQIDDIYLSILLIQYKSDLRTDIFSTIQERYQSEFIYIITFLLSSYFNKKTTVTEKELTIHFILLCFNHIDIPFIYKEIIKICSIFSWVHLSKNTLIKLFKEDPSLISKFSSLGKLNKMENNNTLQSLPCIFLNQLLDDYIIQIENKFTIDNINFYSKVLLLLTDYLSFFITRKYLIPLLCEKHFIERISVFIYNQIHNKTHNDQYDRFNLIFSSFKFYYFFEIDKNKAIYIERNASLYRAYIELNEMHSIAYMLFPDELSKILTENTALTDTRENLKNIILSLSPEQMLTLLSKLGLLTYNEDFYANRTDLLVEIFVSKYERKENIFHRLISLPLYPNETILYNGKYFPEYFSIFNYEPLPIPKLQLSYLTCYDYLLKNFLLFKFESAYQIKEDLEDTIERIHPYFNKKGEFEKFEGWSLMGCPIKNYQIINVKPPLIGEEFSSEVIAEIEYNLNGMQTEIKNEWDKLKKYDVIFAIGLNENYSQSIIRGGEIICIYDEENKNICAYEYQIAYNELKPMGFNRRMLVLLDPVQYDMDLKSGKLQRKFNLLIRREAKENNFKPILQTIKTVIHNISSLPKWLEDPIINRNYNKKASNEEKEKEEEKILFDYYDTFISNEHYLQYKKERNKDIYTSLYNKNTNSFIHNGSNNIMFTNTQIEAIAKGVNKGLTLIVGPPGTGKTDVAVQIANLLYHNFPNEKILILTHSNNALNDIFEKITKLNINHKYMLRLGLGSKDVDSEKDFSVNGRIIYMINKRKQLLDYILQLAHNNNIYVFEEYTCESAINMIQKYLMKSQSQIKSIEEKEKINLTEIIRELKETQMFELLRDQNERKNHLIKTQCKIIAMTCTYAALNRENFLKLNLNYSSVIMEESAQILDIESFIPITLQNNLSNLKRFIMLGDPSQLPPIVKSSANRTYSQLDLSLFSRLLRNKNQSILLDAQGRARKEIVDLYRWRYPFLKDMSHIKTNAINNNNNIGFVYKFQFVNVDDFEGKGEVINDDYSFFNLAEAEYAIGLYMFMCIEGIEPNKISIITSYNAQKELIKEIYEKKCTWSAFFQGIKKISTIDKYQGQQNDFVILSLVRTKNVGYLKDIRRFTVGLSRARLGLYILGRWDLFRSNYELKNTFDILEKVPKKLEVYIDGKNNKSKVVVDDFKHIYRIVQELIKIKKDGNSS